MKRIITLLLIFTCYSSVYAQIDTSSTYRTPIAGQPIKIVTDKYLRASSMFAIPARASFSFGGTVDRRGYGLQLLSNNNLAISGGSGVVLQYLPSSAVVGVYQTIANLSADLTPSAIKYPSVNASLAGLIQNQVLTAQSASFRISGTGQILSNFAVGPTLGSTTSFLNTKDLTGGPVVAAYGAIGTIKSDATTSARGYRATLNTDAASFTLPELILYYATQGTKGSGSSITKQVAFKTDDLTLGDENHGFEGNVSTGALKYNLYMVGTAKNYLNGNLLLGTTTDNLQKLQVNGRMRLSQLLVGAQGTDSVMVHDNVTKEPKLISPNFYYKATDTVSTLATKQYVNNRSYTKAESDALPSNRYTGWALYQDGAYTSGSPLSLTAGVKRTLPNNASVTNESQIPLDIPHFYTPADTLITGRNGDGLNITIEFQVRPTTPQITKITTSINIGGVVGDIFVRDFILTKGSGVTHYYLASFDAYTLDTWQANGGKIKIVSDAAAEVYGIRYIFSRTHKAR